MTRTTRAQREAPQTYWLSFADPKSGENLGVAIVDADTADHAISEAWRRGINPGGEVLSGTWNGPPMPAQAKNRLLTFDEASKLVDELGCRQMMQDEIAVARGGKPKTTH